MGKAVLRIQEQPRCGRGKCHPSFLQAFQNIQSFTFFLCIFAVMSGMFSKYLVSQITTIEKYFGFPSQRSGMIVSAEEIGYLITIVFVGHFLNKSHRPRVLAGCAFTIGVASLLMTMPFFIYGTSYRQYVSQAADTVSSSQLCQRNQTQFDVSTKCNNTTEDGVGNGDVAFGIFILAAILSGCGSTGLYSVGIAFLDDNAGKKEAALYIGFMFCLRSISPVLGLLFGAGISRISVDLKVPKFSDDLNPDDSSWIGAWWIGFLAIGVTVILSGVPLLFYPKHLPKAIERKVSTVAPALAIQSSRKKLKRAAEEGKALAMSFPKSVWKLLRNSVFLAVSIGTMVNVAGGSGYTAFLPKYLESQFHVDTFTANTVTAIVALSSALGMGVSGLLTSRIKMRLNDLFFRTVIVVAVAAMLILSLMSFGCQEVQISGYSELETRSGDSNGSLRSANQTCDQCYCPAGPYEPVCGSNGVTYYSPCHAGCEAGERASDFYGCDCVGKNATSTSGACESDCDMLIPYAVCLIVIIFLATVTTVPIVMVSLRKLNAISPSLRTVEEVKKKWDDIKVRAKKKANEDRTRDGKTGNVPKSPKSDFLTDTERRVIGMLVAAQVFGINNRDEYDTAALPSYKKESKRSRQSATATRACVESDDAFDELMEAPTQTFGNYSDFDEPADSQDEDFRVAKPPPKKTPRVSPTTSNSTSAGKKSVTEMMLDVETRRLC
ncbi:solute carrier organic anion transporter family member 2A1-like [Lineus longissimus]|uniref:solute carrier organic anion transporter family member 2A1-like n=1 Tax=Lineus longissimus TaxID=88925 RepID=UPI00315E02FA